MRKNERKNFEMNLTHLPRVELIGKTTIQWKMMKQKNRRKI